MFSFFEHNSDKGINKITSFQSRKKVEDGEEAQKFQKEYYNRGFRFGDKCPFGEGVLQELHWEKRIRYAKKYVSPGNKVLDLGCGDGRVTKAISDDAEEVIGIDISEECIKRAREVNAHPKIKYHNIPIENFKTQKKFDVVLMFEVIEHIYDPQSIISQIYSILKKNGCLIISTPNFSSLVRRIKKYINPLVLKLGFRGWDEIAPEHICEYSFKEIISMLETHNFEIIKKDGVLLIFPFVEISKRITKNKFLHRINLYSGSLIPSLSIEVYLVAKKK